MLKEVHVDFVTVPSDVGTCSINFSPLDEGIFVATIVDQNGTEGHCIVLDCFLRVIIDPSEEEEVPLDEHRLFKCAGPCSLCVVFTQVIAIKNINGSEVRTSCRKNYMSKNNKKRRKADEEAFKKRNKQESGDCEESISTKGKFRTEVESDGGSKPVGLDEGPPSGSGTS